MKRFPPAPLPSFLRIFSASLSSFAILVMPFAPVAAAYNNERLAASNNGLKSGGKAEPKEQLGNSSSSMEPVVLPAPQPPPPAPVSASMAGTIVDTNVD